MMHAQCTCQCLRGHAMPFPKTKTPLAREERYARERVGNAHTFFSSPPPSFLQQLPGTARCSTTLLEIVETVDRQ